MDEGEGAIAGADVWNSDEVAPLNDDDDSDVVAAAAKGCDGRVVDGDADVRDTPSDEKAAHNAAGVVDTAERRYTCASVCAIIVF
jgi:hypothetical protein